MKKILIICLSSIIIWQVAGTFYIAQAYAKEDIQIDNSQDLTDPQQTTGASEEGAAGNISNLDLSDGQSGDENQAEDLGTQGSGGQQIINPQTNSLPEVGGQGASPQQFPKMNALSVSSTPNVVINEFMANPPGVGTDNNNEWIELYNIGDQPIDISGWKLGDSINAQRSTIPAGAQINAQGFYVFHIVGNYLNNDSPGDTVKLSDNSLTLIDSHSYSVVHDGKTIGRYPDGSDVWFEFDHPTSGSANYLKPLGGEVSDGLTADIQYSNNDSQLSANWSGFSDLFGIDHYQYAFGTSQGAHDIIDWQTTNNTFAVESVSLPLVENQTYYASVKAYNIYNDVSDIVSSDGVTIDLTPPEGLSTSINNGDEYTNKKDVKVTISAFDIAVIGMVVSEDIAQLPSDPLDPSWLPYQENFDFTLSANDGAKTIYLIFKDEAGNISLDPMIGSIILDTQAPSPPIVNAKPGDGYVDLSWNEPLDNFEVDHYLIYRSASPFQKIVETQDLFYRDENVENNKTYSYIVVAVDKAGNPQIPDVSIPEQDLNLWLSQFGSILITATPSTIAEVVGQIFEPAAKTQAGSFIPKAEAAPVKGKVKAETTKEESAPKTEEGNEGVVNWPLIIAIIIAVLIILAGIWYYWVVTRPMQKYSISPEPKDRRVRGKRKR
jgi:hypothetical protein